MALVQDVQELIDRETAANDLMTAPLKELQASHVDAYFPEIPKITDPRPGEDDCEVCGCATVGVAVVRTRKTVRVCREIISALKLASLAKPHAFRVRTYYRLRYIDELPIMSQQHAPLHIAAKQIAAELLEIDDDDDLISHDLVHAVEKHCRGINCGSKRHPGCPRDSADCLDYVQVKPREEA